MSQLTITGGKFNRYRIKEPLDATLFPEVRPTSARVREAIFSALGEIVEGSVFIDVYSGSGILGLEAVSRGAQKAICNDPKSYPFLEQVKVGFLRTFQLDPQLVEIRNQQDVNLLASWDQGLAEKKPVVVLWLDPPHSICVEAFRRVFPAALTAPTRSMYVVLEFPRRQQREVSAFVRSLNGWITQREPRAYGKNIIWILRRDEDAD